MKLRVLCVAALFAGGYAGAQDLKISVRSDSEALPYAYVYLNGRAVAVTDTLGVALLPAQVWQIGDTLSASYVGTKPDTVVIDRKMARTGAGELLLPEMYVRTTEEVWVKADAKRLFHKNVRLCPPFYYQAYLHADFRADISLPDSRSFPISGRFVTRNTHADYLDFAQLDTSNDTLSDGRVAHLFRNDMRDVLCTAKTALASLLYKTYQEKASYSYLGKKDGFRMFRISYPDVQPDMIYQIVIWVGEEDRIIRKYEVNREEPHCTTRLWADGVRKSVYTLILCDHMLMPSRLHAVNSYPDGSRTTFDIENWRMVMKLTGREVKFKD